MTSKDYILIAEAIKWAGTGVENTDALHGIYLAATMIASRLEQDNPRFNRKAFLSACGVVSGTVTIGTTKYGEPVVCQNKLPS